MSSNKVYLFGSRARGDYSKDSDYDFYIIMDDFKQLDGMESVRAKMSLFDIGYKHPVDVIVNTKSVFLENSSNVAFVDYHVKKEGVVIYEKQKRS
ncbi:MAG: nucleotidyltransferase domain-containing protein [Treponema sp.]|nr:nucleotidyltransferase domain-containing protein [Treponema sp.]